MAIARHFLASSAVMEDAMVGSKARARTADPSAVSSSSSRHKSAVTFTSAQSEGNGCNVKKALLPRFGRAVSSGRSIARSRTRSPGDRDIRLPRHQFQWLAAQQSRDNRRGPPYPPLRTTAENRGLTIALRRREPYVSLKLLPRIRGRHAGL
jgi:hypothetical protein